MHSNFYIFVEKYLNRITSPNSRLIHIGSSDGLHSLHLSNKFIVTGIDIETRPKNITTRCNFKQLPTLNDICNFNYNKFDVIYSDHFFKHLPCQHRSSSL